LVDRALALDPPPLSQEIRQNFMDVADWQRKVTGAVEQVELAIRKTRRHFLR
jgi:hypothetical protein